MSFDWNGLTIERQRLCRFLNLIQNVIAQSCSKYCCVFRSQNSLYLRNQRLNFIGSHYFSVLHLAIYDNDNAMQDAVALSPCYPQLMAIQFGHPTQTNQRWGTRAREWMGYSENQMGRIRSMNTRDPCLECTFLWPQPHAGKSCRMPFLCRWTAEMRSRWWWWWHTLYIICVSLAAIVEPSSSSSCSDTGPMLSTHIAHTAHTKPRDTMRARF